MRLTVLGAADSVTGSRHLVQTRNSTQVLLDCGMYQGWKSLRERNWQPMQPAPHTLEAVILSHAHLDHSGLLPALVKEGFRGPIWCSPATRDLAEVLLLDAARLQEDDARRANRGGWSRHQPARALYTRRDAERAITMLRPVAPLKAFSPVPGLQATLTPVGHLLGACAVSLREGEQRLLFSGDLGRDDDLLMPAPRRITQAPDLLLMESTYGDRLHPQEDTAETLGAWIREALARDGRVLVPTFAVGRAQALMLLLQRLRRSGGIPSDLPIYLDSPMALRATRIHLEHRRLLRLSEREASTLCEGVTAVETPAESRRLIARRGPAVVLSSSGMATGGRVLDHLAALAPDPRHCIVFPGYQVPGSRGGKLIDGAPEIKVRGQIVPVRAQVRHLRGLSGHADARGLIDWLRGLDGPPRRLMLVHGEDAAVDALRLRIEAELGWRVELPRQGEAVEVGAD